MRAASVALSAALALAAAPFAGCKRIEGPVPPPVRAGKCLVARYVGATATDQTCQLGGYSWHCLTETAEADARIACNRGPEVSEVPAPAAPPTPVQGPTQ